MDENAKAQTVLPVAFPDIPTPEEHAGEVRKIFTVCVLTAALVLFFSVAVVLGALRLGVSLQTLAFTAPIVMGLVIVTFGIGYAIPVGLVSLRRLEMTIKMGYSGLQMNRTMTNSVRQFLRTADPILKVANAQVQDGYLEKIEGHLKVIADRVKRDTEPLKVKQRTTVEG